MNNQFATKFLREEIQDSVETALRGIGADEDLIRFAVDLAGKGLISPERVVEIAKETLGLEEMTGEGGGSTVGGGTINGATFTPGTGEQYASGKAFKGTRKKKYQENVSHESGLVVVGRTRLDNQKISKVVEEEGLYAEWNPREGYWFFPEELDLYDGLEKVLTREFAKAGIDARFEGVFSEDAPRLAGNPSRTNKQGSKNLNAYKSVGFTKAPSAQEAGKHLKSIEVKDLWGDEEGLNESRAYSKFKKEAATRTKDQQMHEAVKTLYRKLDEVSRLVEFAQQMRTELSEGDQTLEYGHNTKKIFEKINTKVVELYTKTRKLK